MTDVEGDWGECGWLSSTYSSFRRLERLSLRNKELGEAKEDGVAEPGR